MPDTTVDGAVIHYETAGAGFPLVLLHGIGSNSRSWRRQLRDLSANFTVIAWDAPGYGRSSDPSGQPSTAFYADRLRAFIDALQLQQIFLLGHSIGGVIGTMHHLYFSGTPSAYLALGASFSAMEVIPLLLLSLEAWAFMRSGERSVRGEHPHRWAVWFLVAVLDQPPGLGVVGPQRRGRSLPHRESICVTRFSWIFLLPIRKRHSSSGNLSRAS